MLLDQIFEAAFLQIFQLQLTWPCSHILELIDKINHFRLKSSMATDKAAIKEEGADQDQDQHQHPQATSHLYIGMKQ